MQGLHLIAEAHDCRCAVRLLADAAALRELCLAVCAVPGLTPVGQLFHQFEHAGAPAGATGAVILAESHLAVHTWPEIGSVTIDVYVCNFTTDNSAKAQRLFAELERSLKPARTHFQAIQRGGANG